MWILRSRLPKNLFGEQDAQNDMTIVLLGQSLDKEVKQQGVKEGR